MSSTHRKSNESSRSLLTRRKIIDIFLALAIASVTALLFFTAYFGYQTTYDKAPIARIMKERLPELEQVFRPHTNLFRAEQIKLEPRTDGLHIRWLTNRQKEVATLILSRNAKDNKTFRLTGKGAFLNDEEKRKHFQTAIETIAEKGLWQSIDEANDSSNLPRLNAQHVERYLASGALIWAIVFLSGIALLFFFRFQKSDIALFVLLGASALGLLMTSTAAADIKLHFLPNDLGRADIFSIYGLGRPSFHYLLSSLINHRPETVYTANQALALLALAPLYVALSRITKSGFFAAIALILFSLSPAWLRLAASDSAYPAVLYTLGVFLMAFVLAGDTERFLARQLLRLLGLASLTLCLSIRAELVTMLPGLFALWWLMKRPRPEKKRAWAFLAGIAIVNALWLGMNYLLISSMISDDHLNQAFAPLQTLANTFGIMQGNLFFNGDFTPIFLRLLAWAGFALLIIDKRPLWLAAFLLAAFALQFHSFTLKPIFLSLHYQGLLLFLYALLAAYPLYRLYQLFLEKKRITIRIAGLLFVSVLAIASLFQYDTLLSKTPTNYHKEIELFDNTKELFSGIHEVVLFFPTIDTALKNPENFLTASFHETDKETPDFRYLHRAREANINPEMQTLYYRGLICETHPRAAHECKRFEATHALQPIREITLAPETFADETYLSKQPRIGLYRIVSNR